MDTKVRNLLGWAGVFALVIVALSSVSYVKSFARSVEPNSTYRSFTVTAEARKATVPDVAQFTFNVITEGGRDLAALQTQNTEKVNKTIEFVKSQGVEAKDIKTQAYNITPREQFFSCPRDGGPCRPSEIVGYTINQTVQVKVRDFAKASGILGGVVTNGANSVSQLNFTVDDATKLQNEAKAEAITNAKVQAEELARAGKFKLGKLIAIDENTAIPYSSFQGREMAAAGNATDLSLQKAAPTPAIEPGSQEIVATVVLRFEIR